MVVFHYLSAEICCFAFSCILSFLPSSPIQVNIRNTVRVGMNRSEVTILNVTPDANEPVKLECEWTGRDKNWYSDGIKVTTTSGQLNTTNLTGDATLSISTLNANNTGNYTCKVTDNGNTTCLLYTSPSPRDRQKSRMPSSA